VFESHNQAFRPKVQCKYWFRAYLLNWAVVIYALLEA
jgi:hypothetical protein